jgi:hypothetical protein
LVIVNLVEYSGLYAVMNVERGTTIGVGVGGDLHELVGMIGNPGPLHFKLDGYVLIIDAVDDDGGVGDGVIGYNFNILLMNI